jgi:outer membrane protein OmpA-like peptidoglycan-associated protein
MRIALLLLLLILSACNKPLPEFVAKEQMRQDFKQSSKHSCPLAYLGENKDIVVATIYFADNKSTLNKEDNNVITAAANIHKRCPQNILVIGHASNMEAEQNFAQSVSLSLARAQVVAKQLQASRVIESYINILFCGNGNNLVEENNSNHKYNQRVDIVLLSSTVESRRFDCIPTTKPQ